MLGLLLSALLPLAAASADETPVRIPVGSTTFSNLEKGHFIVDGTFHFSKSTTFLPDRGDEPITLGQIAAGTTLAYFVADRLAFGLSSLYTLTRYGSSNQYSLASGPTVTWYFLERGDVAMRAGAGLYWDLVVNPSDSRLNGARLNTNAGLQYFFLPSIAVGPTFNLDFVRGDRFTGTPEFSFGGGSTIYL